MRHLKQIIIVEDSKIIAGIIGITIKKIEGFDAVVFPTGESLLMEINRLQPAGVFLDYHLNSEDKGSLNGGEIALTIKRQFPTLPIFMMTGSSEEQVIDRIKALPIAAFIHKDAEDVLELIEEAVLRFC